MNKFNYSKCVEILKLHSKMHANAINVVEIFNFISGNNENWLIKIYLVCGCVIINSSQK